MSKINKNKKKTTKMVYSSQLYSQSISMTVVIIYPKIKENESTGFAFLLVNKQVTVEKDEEKQLNCFYF